MFRLYIDYRRPTTIIGITRLTDPHPTHQRFNDPRMEFKFFATELNESINPGNKCAPFISADG